MLPLAHVAKFGKISSGKVKPPKKKCAQKWCPNALAVSEAAPAPRHLHAEGGPSPGEKGSGYASLSQG